MCGISGLYGINLDPLQCDRLIVDMQQAMTHRGPDDCGVYAERGRAYLAHNRLSIIDLSTAGHQPLFNEDQTIAVVFNGEIYNYPTLRNDLMQRGHRFRSQTDTEVLVHAYETYGIEFVHQLNGMFAFALWDSRNRRLVLGRDRLGIKPLYLAEVDGMWLFASEVKAILATGLTRRDINPVALQEYFTFQNTLSSATLFAGITLLPQGTVLVFQEDRPLRTLRYWSPVPKPEAMNAEGAIAELQSVFTRSIKRHLLSDVQIGSYLSGGMDSGTIVALSSRQLPRLLTFTAGFDTRAAEGREALFDERKMAELTAAECNTEHYERFIHSGDVQRTMARLIWHLEDLRVGMSYQNFLMAELAGQLVKVVMSGAGGDELFAGYPWRYAHVAQAQTLEDFNDRYFTYWNRLVPLADQPNFFGPAIRSQLDWHYPRTVFEEISQELPFTNPVDHALIFELRTFLHGLLIVGDKVNMAHSLEERVPFLDLELVELALRIPTHLKLRDGQGKWILRQALAPFLPGPVTEFRKQGFSAPEETWYRGPLRGYVEATLLGDRFLHRDFFNPDVIRRIVDDFLNRPGNGDRRLLLWSLLSFDQWCRIFLEGERPDEQSDRPPLTSYLARNKPSSFSLPI